MKYLSAVAGAMMMLALYAAQVLHGHAALAVDRALPDSKARRHMRLVAEGKAR